jgi:hypothetical protein
LCPPLGDELTLTYPTLRALADELAKAGFAVLRFDYAGTGDSADPQSPGSQVEVWRRSVVAAVEFARSWNCGDVSLVGLRLGATVVASVASSCESLRTAVLWDPCLSGRHFLRQQQALQTMESGPPEVHADGAKEAGGYLYDAATAAALGALKLDEVTIGVNGPDATATQYLLLARPGDETSGAISRMRSHPSCSFELAVEQDALLHRPSFATRVPVRTIKAIRDFLAAQYTAAKRSSIVADLQDQAVVAADGARATIERFVTLDGNGTFGIVTEPASEPVYGTLICTNVAAEHHIGPRRAWVELARAASGSNLMSIRFDRTGAGDSGPVPLGNHDAHVYTPAIRDEVGALIETIARWPSSNWLCAVGSCSGAWSLAASAPANLRMVWLVNFTRWTRKGVHAAAPPSSQASPRLDSQRKVDAFFRVRPIPRRWRDTARTKSPYWLVLWAARVGIAQCPEPVLARLARRGARVEVTLSPPDWEGFRKKRGLDAMRRLRSQGTSVDINTADDIDHALMRVGARRGLIRHIINTAAMSAAAAASTSDDAAKHDTARPGSAAMAELDSSVQSPR